MERVDARRAPDVLVRARHGEGIETIVRRRRDRDAPHHPGFSGRREHLRDTAREVGKGEMAMGIDHARAV
jgi:hypothetical protein